MPSSPPPTRPEPFTIHVDDAVLKDLEYRLAHARLPRDFANDDWRYGTNGDYLAELVRYWREEFDWRAQEREMMQFAHFRTSVDGVPVHFIHERGKGPDPIPIMLNHGWPWTFWDMHKLIGPLTDPEAFGASADDAFDVIVPSLPGMGFSSPVVEPGVNFVRTADLWHELMVDVLGYPRFAAHGGDWGSAVTAQLGHKYADDLFGIHLTTTMPLATFNAERPWDLMGPLLARELSDELRATLLARERRNASHLVVNMLDPQTLAYAMNDSPVGLCAWLLERRRSWSDCHGDVERRFSKDELLTSVMIPWVTETFGTSCRFYREASEQHWNPSHDRTPVVQAPTAISVFLPDVPALASRDWYSDYYNLHYVNEWPTGGHFAAAEEPDAVVHDLREAFRSLRSVQKA